jgi:hypothetical protein
LKDVSPRDINADANMSTLVAGAFVRSPSQSLSPTGGSMTDEARLREPALSRQPAKFDPTGYASVFGFNYLALPVTARNGRFCFPKLNVVGSNPISRSRKVRYWCLRR